MNPENEVRVTLRPGQRLVVVYEPAPDATPASPPPRLTLDEVAALTRSTPRALRALIAHGKLPAKKIGRAYLVAREDAERLARPELRAVPDARREPRSETARAARQLERAGIRLAS